MEPLDPKRYTITYSWKQPYLSMNHEVYVPREILVQRELDLLDEIDRRVQNLLTYPDAERIINKLRGN